MIEKSEECPRCGEVRKWLYDVQICVQCYFPEKAPELGEIVMGGDDDFPGQLQPRFSTKAERLEYERERRRENRLAALEAVAEAARILCGNAAFGADPRTNCATDCYFVPTDDIGTVCAALDALKDTPAEE